MAALNGELAAMSMSIPSGVGAAGELGESQDAVAERHRILRALTFREYLHVRSLVSRP